MNDSVLQQLRLKYFLKNDKGELLETTPEEMYKRVAHAIASAETTPENKAKWEQEFYEMMESNTFLPNSPCLMNAGTEIKSLAACFVVDIEDSRQGIANTLGEAMEIFAAGGGVGFPFSKLRAKGDLVSSTKGKASGPVSFAHMYDAMTETIMQGGKRRGASMGTLNVSHPDILEFISVKRNKTKLNNFNLSVLLTHEFMESIDNNQKEFWAKDPSTGERRGFNLLDGTVGPINPQDIMKEIVDGGWSDGEPGVYFIDNAQDGNPFPEEEEDYKILGPNPCWSGDTRVWTVDYGWQRFDVLSEWETDVEIFCIKDNELTTSIMHRPHMTQLRAEVIEVTVRGNNGKVSNLRVTPEHNLFLSDGTMIMAKDLKVGDGLYSCYERKANSKGYRSVTWSGIPSEQYEMTHNIVMRTPDGYHAHHKNEKTNDNRRWNLELREVHSHLSEHKQGNKNPIHKVTTEGRNRLINRSHVGENNGRWRSDISTDNIKSLLNQGLTQRKVAEKLGCSVDLIQKRLKKEQVNNHTVIAVNSYGEKVPVYNGMVDEAHNYFVKCGDTDGILSKNCGEAVLRAWESCVLGSINLTKFVKDGAFDTASFSKTVEKCVRFLDNVIDVSEPPLKKIAETTRDTRKLGLGVMGLHDTLLMLELPYSLSKSVKTKDTIELIFKTLRTSAEKASKDLAKERGPFPAFDKSTIKTPRRNAMLLSIAPTGTIARICNVSFGIEPNMYWEWDNNLVDIKYTERHLLAKVFLDLEVPLPDFFETALEISPSDHLEMQALVQKYVDQAISKTVLLPNSATKADIEPLYLKAWKKGLKGFTVYRDGSRTDQPISSTTECLSEELTVRFRDRTDVLHGPSYKIRTPEGNLYADVHHNDKEEVCEVMLQLGDGFTDTEKSLANWAARLISKALQHGMDYDEVVKQGASTEFEHKSRAYPGRVFWFGTNGKRKAYRSIPEVMSDLVMQEVNKLAYGPPDRYEDLDEEEEIIPLRSANEHVCPTCGKGLVYAEGCLGCISCGYSKCT